MSWESLAGGEGATGANLGTAYEAFLARRIGSVPRLRTLLFMAERDLESHAPGGIAKDAGLDRASVEPALQHLQQEKLVARAGLLGGKWRYLPDNQDSILIYNLRKLWKHPRTHALFVKRMGEIEGGAAAAG